MTGRTLVVLADRTEQSNAPERAAASADPVATAAPVRTVRHYRFRMPLHPAALLRFYLTDLLVPHSRSGLVRAGLARAARNYPRIAAALLGARQAAAPDPAGESTLHAALCRAGLAGADPASITLEDYRQSARGKSVAFVFDRGAEHPRLIAKSSADAAQSARLAREQEVIRAIRAKVDAEIGGSLPEPLGRITTDRGEAYCERYLPGRSMYAEMRNGWMPRRHVQAQLGAAFGWLARFQQATKSGEVRIGDAGPTGPLAVLRNLRETSGLPPREEAFLAKVIRQAEDLADERLPIVAVHGDFWVRNLAVRPEGLAVFDWENCSEQGLPFSDLLHFAITYGRSYPWTPGTWTDPVSAFNRTLDAGGWLGPVLSQHLQAYCRDMGLAPDLLKLAMPSFLAQRAMAERSECDDPAGPTGDGVWRRTFRAYVELARCASFGS
ncbi:MAG: aminoglycoside phosphotransferase family protein [Novosphingobium sp.]